MRAEPVLHPALTPDIHYLQHHSRTVELVAPTLSGSVLDTNSAPRAHCLDTVDRLLNPPSSCRAAAGFVLGQVSSGARESVASSHRDSPS